MMNILKITLHTH